MGLLPEILSALDAAGLPVPGARFTRVHPTSPEARKLSEANWDDIICANLSSLADALRAASVIAEDSTLLLLGRQVDAVDLVFAEVPKSHDDDGDPDLANLATIEPRRLVLLEDKLVRNPGALVLDVCRVAAFNATLHPHCGMQLDLLREKPESVS